MVSYSIGAKAKRLVVRSSMQKVWKQQYINLTEIVKTARGGCRVVGAENQKDIIYLISSQDCSLQGVYIDVFVP